MRLGHPLYRFERVTSTMDVLTKLADEGAPEGTTVVAGFQEQGRGRGDRRWHAPPDTALLASVLLRPNLPLPRLMPLSLLAADAIRAAAVPLYGIDAQIKWPNDVLIDGRKLSGVLIQTRSVAEGLAVVAGLGVNANVHPADLPPTGTSLLAETDRAVDRDILLTQILEELATRYRELLEDRLAERWTTLHRHLAMVGEEVMVVDAGREVHGQLRGVDPDGALVLDVGAERRRVVAGDLSRGPRPALRG